MEKVTRTNKRRRLKKMRIASTIFALLSLISLGIFSYFLFETNVVPIKYIGIMYGIIGIIYIFLFIIFFKKKCKNFLRIFAYIFSVILSGIFIFGSIYLNTTNKFFDKVEVGDYDKITYSVLVLKDSDYTKIGDLKNKKIGLIKIKLIKL